MLIIVYLCKFAFINKGRITTIADIVVKRCERKINIR